MDFETHKKFAKLMDPNDIQQKPATDSIVVIDTDTPGTFQHQVGQNSNMPPVIDLLQTDQEADFAQLEENSRMNLQTAFDAIPELQQHHEEAQDRKPTAPAVAPAAGIQKSDHQIYLELLETLKTDQNNVKIAEALEGLTDLASDMDFGLKLSEGEGLRTLVQHVRCSSKDRIVCDDQRRVRSVAALVIGTSLQVIYRAFTNGRARCDTDSTQNIWNSHLTSLYHILQLPTLIRTTQRHKNPPTNTTSTKSSCANLRLKPTPKSSAA